MHKRPETCSGCLLNETPGCTGFMPTPEGKGLIPLMIVGEALGEHEAKDSLPFRPYADSGSLLERALRSVGLQREQIVITNLIHCRPPGNLLAGQFYEDQAVNHCRQYLDAEVARFKPRAILALGAIPFKYLSGFTGRGKQAQDYTRGYPVESVWYPGTPVIGTYHPSYLRRGATELFPVVVHDLHKALMIARGRTQWTTVLDVNYQAGGVAELQWLYELFVRYSERLIAYDLETRESSTTDEDAYDGLSLDAEIITVQFSWAPGTGMSVPWNEETKPWIQRILALPNPRSGHNVWLFDEPQLRAKGITLPQLSMDTMAKWHHLQPDLPANLSFVSSFYGIERPWKHEMGQDFIRYGCIDVDAVQRIESKINQDLAGLRYRNPSTGELGISLLEGYEEYVVPLRPILQRMEERGIPRDAAATAELVEYIDREKERLNTKIQASCPDAIKPTQSWTSWPEDCRPLVKAYAEANLVTPISEKTGKPLKARVPVIKIEDGASLDPIFDGVLELGYKFQGNANGGVWKLYKRLPFLPNSTEHLKSYLRHFGIKIPTDLSNDETTGRTELDKLMKRLKLITEAESVSKVTAATWAASFLARATRDNFEQLKEVAGRVYSFLEAVLTYRKLHKAKATYITGEGWTPNPVTGRIHTTFTLSATATLQLSSRKPNVQNIPKGKNPKDVVGTMLGKLLRKTVKAKPGHLIVEFDYGGCHLVTMGLEAEDPQYIRLARIDGHSFLAAHMARVELGMNAPAELSDLDQWLDYDDQTLAAKLAWVKKNFKGLRNDKAKPCIAEDELVLTSRGLIPIQAVKLDDLVWDGIEWVSHQGVICKGYKEVITYEGLTATPDHEVYTKDGRKIPFGQAASELVGLEDTGIEGQTIRTTYDHFRSDPTSWEKESNPTSLSMLRLRLQSLGRSILVNTLNRGWLQTLRRPTNVQAFNSIGETLRCYYSSLLQSCESSLPSLRRSWDSMQVRVAPGVYYVGFRELASQRLQRDRVRSHKQRWSLRAWELAPSNSFTTNVEQMRQRMDGLRWGADLAVRVQQSLRTFVDTQIDSQGLQWGGDNSYGTNSCSTQSKELEGNPSSTRKVRVYDILNAGPRHRFTVSGKLVSNCLLGNQLGLGSRKLYSLNDDTFKNEAEAKQVQALLSRLFPKIGAYQQRTRALAQRQGYLISPYGSIRRFFEVERYDTRSQGLVAGLDAEKAGAFYVQTNAQGKLREAMIELEEEGWNERCGLINQVHDSLVYEMPIELLPTAVPAIAAIMERPAKRLKHPTICPDGLVLMCEASVGPDWGSIEEVKIVNGRVEAWPESVRGLIS